MINPSVNIDENQKYFLRNEIGAYMNTLAKKDERVVAIAADLYGTSRIKGLVEEFPDRCYNVGIAEQDMVSFAAGLAHEGFIPYTFTMSPFLSMRACEQVRTDVAYANLNVRLMSLYGGVSGGISGATHWGVEDIGIMTSIPNITVVEPCDPVEARKLMDLTLKDNGPLYIRTSVEPSIQIYEESLDYEIGKAITIREGKDSAFIVSGVTVKYALEAADRLSKECGIEATVIDMHTIKPIDKAAVLEAAETGHIIVAEDHNIYGGLGSMIAMVLAEESISCKFKNIGYPDKFVAMAHAPYLYHEFGYDADGLFEAMKGFFNK